jgi:hypothetical protein
MEEGFCSMLVKCFYLFESMACEVIVAQCQKFIERDPRKIGGSARHNTSRQ